MNAIAGSADEEKTGCWGWSNWHCYHLEGSVTNEVKELSSTYEGRKFLTSPEGSMMVAMKKINMIKKPNISLNT